MLTLSCEMNLVAYKTLDSVSSSGKEQMRVYFYSLRENNISILYLTFLVPWYCS